MDTMMTHHEPRKQVSDLKPGDRVMTWSSPTDQIGESTVTKVTTSRGGRVTVDMVDYWLKDGVACNRCWGGKRRITPLEDKEGP